jgi:predicted ATPase/DNA-binding SARP family transcriptional activator
MNQGLRMDETRPMPEPRLDIAVLGPLQLRWQGKPLPLRGPRRRALLALLTLTGHLPKTAPELASRLWPASVGPDRLAPFYALVSRLRSDLAEAGAVLVSDPAGYALDPARYALDATRFELILDGVRSADDSAEQLRQLDLARSLWRGEPWCELADDEVARARSQHLKARLRRAQRHRGELLLQLGRAEELLADIGGLRLDDPDDDHLVGLHCRALYLFGNQRDALGELRRYTARLAEETGLTSSPRLAELERRLLNHDIEEPPGLPRVRAGPRNPGGRVASSSARTSPFRGRERELAELEAQLTVSPLVTVVGAAGTGKSRLAVELVCGGNLGSLPTAFVELAEVQDGGSVPDVAAAALGVQIGERAGVLESVLEYLAAMPHLLLVDNCEHLLGEVRRLVSVVLACSPRSRILATSRAPLHLGTERVLRLAPLPVDGGADGSDSPATQVFLDTAGRVGALPERSLQNDARVTALCRSLDGLPLAIELAASRLTAFSLADLAERLDRRLDLLGDEHSDHERHRTLRATLDWSYDLLDEGAKRLFRLLAVMPAGIALDTVEWFGLHAGIGSDILINLAQLVDSSMVVRVDTACGSRYLQLETMRTFGVDRLDHEGEREAAEALMAAWCLQLVARQHAELLSVVEPYWNQRIRHELPNIRAVRAYLCKHARLGDLVALATDLDEWARVRDVGEIWVWSEELLALTASADPRLRARVLAIAAQGAFRRHGFSEARRLAQQALDGEPDRWTEPRALTNLGAAYLFAGDFDDAVRTFMRRVAVDGDVSDWSAAAFTRAYAGDIDGARATAHDALSAARASGSPSAIASAEYALGEIEAVAGSGHHAVHLEAAIEFGTLAGTTHIAGVAQVTLTAISARQGAVETACNGYLDLIEHWLKSGTWIQMWTTLRNVADLLIESDPETALTIWDSAAGDRYAPGLAADAAEDLARCHAEVVDTLGRNRAAAISAEAHLIERAELVDRARCALLALRQRRAVASDQPVSPS